MTWALSDKTPKCDICLPELLPENKKIFNVYVAVRNQHIMGFGGPVDLNLRSLDFIMNIKRLRKDY